jgi:hypothetical protein
VKLPAEDRIFTITEGKGITDVLCAKQPCLRIATTAVKSGSRPARTSTH